MDITKRNLTLNTIGVLRVKEAAINLNDHYVGCDFMEKLKKIKKQYSVSSNQR